MKKRVAIPSYSEVLFLLTTIGVFISKIVYKVAIPSYSEVLFLHYGLYRIIEPYLSSQSLLIQRSYSYKVNNLHYQVYRESQSLLIQRSYSYKGKYQIVIAHGKSQSLLIQRSYSYLEAIILIQIN